MLYDVTWSIEIEADSPEQAAQFARDIQRDTETPWAGTFDLEDENGRRVSVDLDAEGGPSTTLVQGT